MGATRVDNVSDVIAEGIVMAACNIDIVAEGFDSRPLHISICDRLART